MDITAILFLLIVTLILHLVEEIKTGFKRINDRDIDTSAPRVI